MFIHHLKVSGLLSFGAKGIDLPLQALNVLIGPNGSGKSNLLEVLSLLRASPTSLPRPVKEMGGVGEWLWKGPKSARTATIDALVDYPKGKMRLRHVLEITEHGERFEVADERIEYEKPMAPHTDPYFFYRFQRGRPALNDFAEHRLSLQRENVKPEESILSQYRDPERYPALYWLQEQYERIRLYRDWKFGPNALWRSAQSAASRGDVLAEDGENLSLVLSKILPSRKSAVLAALKRLYDGINDIHVVVGDGKVLLYLVETGGREIPASRLSDGTLRYLSLLAILLQPTPPPIVAIEEPELGLHPDVMLHIAELLVDASTRTQLVVTTHSRLLIDALTEVASSVIVCSKEDGESRFERLADRDLAQWLDRYTLGDLWSKGEIGGNPS